VGEQRLWFDAQPRIKDLHEGQLVCLWEAPETILRVIDWETDQIETFSFNAEQSFVAGHTVVGCKRVYGPAIDADLINNYVCHGRHQNCIKLDDLREPNPMLVLALEASLPNV
jgi:hypothetical protein